jgi:cytochrome bd-type quinol oxidase subunit 2
MIGNLDYALLQQIWWLIVSVVGSLFVFLLFVQGGQSMLFTLPHNDEEKALMVNSLGRKWKLTFTTLVLFGGALFAAFPKFYATSFGGAYWVWMLILFTFIVQAVAYEYRKKPDNFLGAWAFEFFLFINGTVGVLLIGTAVGTFFTGAAFALNEYNQVTWQTSIRGLEAAGNLFNLAIGFFLIFLLVGLGLVIYGVVATSFQGSEKGIWIAGLGTVLTALGIFLTAGYNDTAFYPSYADLQSSLSIHNASSSKYTLTAMTYVALGIPFVLAYVAYVWKLMDNKKLTPEELTEGENAHEMY